MTISSNQDSGFRSRARPPARGSLPIRLAISVRNSLLRLRLWFLRRVVGMDLHPGCSVSLKARLDFTNPTGVHIGDGTYVAFGAVVLAHDMSRVMSTDTYIGCNCFVGANAIIMPGVRIGDHCIVGSGSVVTQDVPARSIVGGNPAKILRSGINTRRWGILEEHFEARLRENAAGQAGGGST